MRTSPGVPAKHGQDERVDTAGLARSGGASHEQVRHLGHVGHDHAALDVLAQRHQHRVVFTPRRRRAQHVAEHDDLWIAVRDLDTDSALARDRADDAHVRTLHRIGDVPAELDDAFHLDAGAQLDLVTGDGWSPVEAGDTAVDAELAEDLRQRRDHLVVGLGVG
jgi:hypothetical protein